VPRRLWLSVPHLSLFPWIFAAACSAFSDASPTSGPGSDAAAGSEGGTGEGGGSPSDPPTDAGDGGPVGPYREEVLRDEPIAYWRLGERAGEPARDETGRQTAGSYAAGCQHGQPSLVPSVTNLALGISGTCSAVLPLSFDFSEKTPFTIEVWIHALVAAVGWQTIFAKRAVDNATSLHIDNGQLTFERKIGTRMVAASTPILEDVVYYVVATFDGATSRLYVNGQVRDNKNDENSQTPMPSTNPIIGEGFDGDVDEVAVYAKALSGSAINRHLAASQLRSDR
jgi:hypothetical protein